MSRRALLCLLWWGCSAPPAKPPPRSSPPPPASLPAPEVSARPAPRYGALHEDEALARLQGRWRLGTLTLDIQGRAVRLQDASGQAQEGQLSLLSPVQLGLTFPGQDAPQRYALARPEAGARFGPGEAGILLSGAWYVELPEGALWLEDGRCEFYPAEIGGAATTPREATCALTDGRFTYSVGLPSGPRSGTLTQDGPALLSPALAAGAAQPDSAPASSPALP